MLWLNFSARTYALAFALLGCTVQTGITAWGAPLHLISLFPCSETKEKDAGQQRHSGRRAGFCALA
jgi:hypothetical protein